LLRQRTPETAALGARRCWAADSLPPGSGNWRSRTPPRYTQTAPFCNLRYTCGSWRIGLPASTLDGVGATWIAPAPVAPAASLARGFFFEIGRDGMPIAKQIWTSSLYASQILGDKFTRLLGIFSAFPQQNR